MFEIHTLRLGELSIPSGGAILRDPIHAWLVTDGRLNVLVDSGMPSAQEIERRLKVAGKGGGGDVLRAELARCGVAPEQITHVVLTHLHFDHAWNLDLFPQACIVVQRDEVFHAVDPAPTQRIYYFKETLIALLERKRPSGLLLVDGDHALAPGLDLIKAPGHTPGMQAVLARTQKGCVGLVSDLGDHYRCWRPDDPRATRMPLRYLAGGFLPGAIRSESEHAYLASMAKLRGLSDIVVPAHDFRIPSHMPRDWWDGPSSIEDDLTHSPAPQGP